MNPLASQPGVPMPLPPSSFLDRVKDQAGYVAFGALCILVGTLIVTGLLPSASGALPGWVSIVLGVAVAYASTRDHPEEGMHRPPPFEPEANEPELALSKLPTGMVNSVREAIEGTEDQEAIALSAELKDPLEDLDSANREKWIRLGEKFKTKTDGSLSPLRHTLALLHLKTEDLEKAKEALKILKGGNCCPAPCVLKLVDAFLKSQKIKEAAEILQWELKGTSAEKATRLKLLIRTINALIGKERDCIALRSALDMLARVERKECEEGFESCYFRLAYAYAKVGMVDEAERILLNKVTEGCRQIESLNCLVQLWKQCERMDKASALEGEIVKRSAHIKEEHGENTRN